MPTIHLVRETLREPFQTARDAHPGLLMQRGLRFAPGDVHGDAAPAEKTDHIRRVCAAREHSLYQHAYARWSRITSDTMRFHRLEMQLESRLFIGLTGGGLLETGCALSHSYGMPYIPGSSVKGVVRAHVRDSVFARNHPQIVNELLGVASQGEAPDSPALSGLVVFHDAWWIPGSAAHPMVEEIVTSHHLDYYGSEGEKPATDFDSPIPNAQIAVQGQFLFVLEGPLAWRDLAAQMLQSALSERGIGAKTRSGHGLFQPAPPPSCHWVEEALQRLAKQHNSQPGQILRSRALAEAWQAISDRELKAEALADIQRRWEAEGWWGAPPGKSARIAREIYGSN